jgi:hypothetical protein
MYVVEKKMRPNESSELISALAGVTSYNTYDDAKTAAELFADIVSKTISRVKYGAVKGLLDAKVTVEKAFGKFVVADDKLTVAEFSVKTQGVNL